MRFLNFGLDLKFGMNIIEIVCALSDQSQEDKQLIDNNIFFRHEKKILAALVLLLSGDTLIQFFFL